MSREILEAVRAIEKEKGIEPETLVEALEDALLAAYKKTPGAARHAQVALDHDSGDFRVYAIELPADLVDQAGLAGAIRSDDDVALALGHGEVEIVGDDQAAEGALQVIDAEHVHGGVLRHRMLRSAPQRPLGKNMTQQIKVTPMMASQRAR